MHTQKLNAVTEPSTTPVDKFQQAFQLHQRGQLEQADILYKTVLIEQPHHIDALHFSGVLANQQGQAQRAVDLIRQALDIDPNNAAAHSNLGLALYALKRFDEALASYDRALTIKPNNAEAHYNRGNALLALKQPEEAILSFDRALSIKRDYTEALSNRGIVLKDVKRYDEALDSYNRALAIQPDCAEALVGCGVVLQDLKRFDDALISYDHAVAIKPDLDFILGIRLHTKMNLCNWGDFDTHLNELTKAIERGEKVVIPFTIQAVSSSATVQKKAAEIYTKEKHPSNFLLPPLIKHTHSKIKIAYFSSDFRHHPVAYLTAELFERHDRSRFEVIAFSFHATNDKDDMRLRLEAAFDQFIDVSQQSDEQIVRLARELEIDIAIDLNGCTDGCRTDIFAMRAAPIQMSYIGYLGTMGADYIDYLLADTTLIPVEHQTYYNEKIAYLPQCFQVNDSTLRIADKIFTRAEVGLPAQSFVFCCFNNHYKITPAMFASWMRILHDVENSVLWLRGDNVGAETNLRLAATAQGINAERLVFANALPMSEHLARHRLADLFLDTAPYNAGATASAALWAGLPVLTYLGETFSGRMAASLLYAIGLPELVTQNIEDYEALAIKLATQPQQLATIKQKLADNRLTYPLFNTALFTQHIESAYQAMFDRYQADLAPDHIYVPVRDHTAKSTDLPPANVATFQQAFELHQQGQLEQADILYKAVLTEQPQHIDALHFSGVLANQRGQAQRAVDLITQVLKISPDNAAAHSNLGLALHALKRFDEAIASYDQALVIKPNNAEAHYNRGNALLALKRFDETILSYDRALAIRPDYIEVLSSLGMILRDINRLDEALTSYERILAIKPDSAEAEYGCGVILQELKRFNEAIIYYDRALAIKPDLEFTFSTWLYVKMTICDWDNFDNYLNKLEKAIDCGEKVAIPFMIQAISSSAALQKKVAEIYTKAQYPSNFLLPPLIKHSHSKIRIGYFSSDFRSHAAAYLTAELFESHDRSRFEVIAFSFSPTNHKDDMRLRLEAAFDQFIDINYQSDEQVVRLARELEIDIAVDLNGFTQHARTNLFAMRVAPIQVNYLGYPGTMGASYMDYLIASPVLIPTEYQPYYTEKIVYLPNNFMINADCAISNRQFTRVELGLPEHGFVFCCFNNNHKIIPTVFDSWMRILHQVEGSVLWLLGENITAETNLRLAATARGIAAERLVFANRLPMADYLVRHRVADLFLDTSPYNAHTTASSALWSGLPVLTCVGETFAGRMAAGLLDAIGLPELITTTTEDYETLAVTFATHPQQLATIKQKLADNRLTYPLFNNALFTQHIESAFQAMFDRYQADLAPDHIYVSAQHQPAIKSLPPSESSPATINKFQQAMSLHQGGQLAAAAALYEEILQTEPQHVDTLHFLGVLKSQIGQPQLAVDLIQQSLNINPNNAAAYSNIGLAFQTLNRFDEAFASYDRALIVNPNDADTLFNRGNLLLAVNHFDEAIASYDRLLTISLNSTEALCNRGIALRGLKRFDEALASYDRALTLKPDDAGLLTNRGNVLTDLKRFNEALSSYDHSLVIIPNDTETLTNRGNVLRELNRLDDAIASYERALTITPDYAEALYHQGISLQTLKRWDEACTCYEHALTINPDYEFLFGTWLSLKMKVCDWREFDTNLSQVTQKITQGEKVFVPFVIQAISSSAVLQKKAAEIYAQEKCPSAFLLPPLVKHAHSKIKLAYFSSDFRDHPVACLTAELFEHHDRLRFEIIAFSFSPASGKDDMRLRLEAAFDQFIDVSQQSDEQVVRLARELEIDIAIDLNGFTEGCRTSLFAMRVAPIQVSYLGYLGTMGTDYMDYLLADSTLIPAEHQAYYNEKIAYLPHSFQVNDSTLRIANKTFTRAELGLPAQGFVFCCFNNHYKITPAVFASWMRILQQVDGSVLWLLGDNVGAETNLRREATAKGIDAKRLVFAKRLPIPDYLACHRLADLFLDTSPYNAGATASAALWAGLPILTCLGETFAGRMAAGLLHAIGLPELITTTFEDYETLAVQLATHPEQLAIIKQKLAANRLTYPLFNTVLFTQHLESAFQAMFDRYQAGLAPDHIYVSAQAGSQSPLLPANTAIKKSPSRFNPLNLFGKIAALTSSRKNKTTIPQTEVALLTQADVDTFEQAQRLHRQGQLVAAEILFEALLKTQPHHAETLRCLAALKKQRGQTQITTSQALNIKPNNAPAHLDEVIAHNDNAPVIDTAAVEALINEGNELEDLNRLDEALANYDRALSINPDYARAHSNRGNVLQSLKRFDEALASYDNALAIRPDYAEAFYNRGNTLQAIKHFDKAIASYDRALAIKPDFILALIGRGNALHDCKRFSDALISYENALVIQPDSVEALSNRGNVLYDLKRYDDALASYERALVINPDYAEALVGCGIVLEDLKHFNDVIVSYDRALAIKPDYKFLFGAWLHAKMNSCNWDDFDNHLNKLAKDIERGKKASIPFTVQAISSSAALQQKAAEIYTKEKYTSHFPLLPLAKHTHSTIKIAYFSSDFCHHPISYLMAELFERHDRSQFEVIAFSLRSENHKDDLRLRLEAAFDQFIDVSQQSDEQVTQLARELEIDIAVDLNGFTKGGRTNLFAMRVAPIQVSYLGYLGTMGADYMDYLLADETLIPVAHQAYYNEKIAYLPQCFQVNDSTLHIADKTVTRVELDLPEQGFVFCCFNNHYKITPAVFASWMRILQQVDGSVLWLLGGNVDAETNLRLTATTKGIDAERLIFAKRLPMPEYLARHHLADLFLDTSPYNAGATASAALWAGLPVLTYLGDTFSGRMAASLLYAIGLPELVTQNLEDYEALAIKLAIHPEQLAVIKQKLADNRLTYPLFNTALFTQHIESAYQAMFERYQAGLAPDHIYVLAQDDKFIVPTLQRGNSSSNAPALLDAGASIAASVGTMQNSSTVVIDSEAVEALINQGNELEDLNRLDDALASYDKALAMNPDYARAHSNRGNVLQSLKRFDEALASYDRALAIRPDYPEAFFNRGNALQAQGRLEEALISYDCALAIKPDFVIAIIGRGAVLQDLKRFDEALATYDRVLRIQPDYAEAHYNRANVLQDLKRTEEALASYDRALAIRPEYIEALSNRGALLHELKRFDEALISYDRALVIQPEHLEILARRGIVLQVLNRFDEAISSYEQALAIKPDMAFMFGTWLHIKMKTCDWRDFDHNLHTLTEKITQGEKVCTPFAVQAMSTSAAVQQKAAEIYAQEKYPSAFLLPPLIKHAHAKIKIGYFSSDFRNHPVAYLTAELFECHDRSRFEVIAFSFSPSNHKAETRLRLESACDQFIDVSEQSDEQVVRLARQLGCDIAVDLNGFTDGCRANLFAMRVAPIQVSYLGYLGTMGADYMDYLLADATLIPVEHQAYYREKIAYLPQCFQVNDSKLPIADKQFTRAELDLPEQGFVFCCFNNNFKITPAVFDSWMRLLQQVEGSVLWLLGDNDTATKNLRLAAIERGIAAERIVFAKRLPMPEYLARHQVADLFLDTSPYNAGATASAALWAGLPVLTYLGETFAGRMAASLLNAIGLSELITKNPADYEALAVKLATHPEQLATIKQKLADNRLTCPLFNTALFTQHIESAFQTMFDRYQAGLTPEHIYVSAQDTNPPPAQQIKPSQADIDKFQQALSLHQRGQLADAEVLYEQLLQTQPQHVDALHFLGVLKHQNGQSLLAVDLIQQSLKLQPNNAAAHSNLGMALQALNRFEEALASYDKVLIYTPHDVIVLLARGNLLQALNRPDEALTSYDKALAIKPNAIDVLLGRGIVLQLLHRFDDALVNYDHLLAIDANHAEALLGRANVLYNLKRLNEALSSYDRSLAINPDSFDAYYNRGVALADLNRVDDAIASYQQALAFKPDYVEVHNNLATLFKKQNRFSEAEASYQRAIDIKPDYIEAHCNLITLIKDQGQLLKAETSLNIALATIPDSIELRFIKLIMTLPIAPKTITDSALVPHQFDAALTELSAWLASSPVRQESLNKVELFPLPFLLAYRVGNHVQCLSRYGDLVAAPNKSVIFAKSRQKKIRMIVVSHHFRRHSVWDVITRGLLANLDRTRFELILYHLGAIEDAETAFAKSLADEWRDTHTITDSAGWLTAFATDTPDVIFYPEIGMDPMSARLAAYRIAPLQMASWGHPITTGLPNIDVYFSGELLESPDADTHYRERLIRLPSTGCCTTPIPIKSEPLGELENQLAMRQGVRFIIAQTIYKFDPTDDALYADIASVVGDSTFILLSDRDNAWAMSQIVARLEQTFIDRGLNPQQHLLVIPWQSMEKFQSLLELCDVYLDCPSFSGYTTAWQAVHRGLPIVTLEGEFMRQRLAAGLLRKIGITDTIASSREEYVQLATKLAGECRNPIQRSARRHALKTAAPKADNDVSVVRAFEQHVIEALAERRGNL